MPNPFDAIMFVLLTWGVIEKSGWLKDPNLIYTGDRIRLR